MTADLFKLLSTASRASFSAEGVEPFVHGDAEQGYQFIENGEFAEYLAEKRRAGRPMFDRVDGDRLDDVLDDAEAAVEAIEQGDVDDILDYVLYAERAEYGPRVTVVRAIEERNQAIVEERKADPGDALGGIDPTDMNTA